VTDPIPVVIEAALNGGRTRDEHLRVPYTPAEVADDAARCAAAGAQVVHIHARTERGDWSADAAWYAEAHRRIRARTPETLISITSIRPAHVPVTMLPALLTELAADPRTRPDCVSVNLGHIVAWEPASDADGPRQRTVHFPNDYEDIAALLAACRTHGITPELGIMDIGFLSNAVTLRNGGLLPASPWFLIELDSPAYGAGRQVAPATVANYDHLAAEVRAQFPDARWAAHGAETAGYAVLARALATGAHIRVGFEDAIALPDGRRATDNAELVAWAVAAAGAVGRRLATVAETRSIISRATNR
jgi:3-keto-5-aminohexanoate cleavage enzyme